MDETKYNTAIAIRDGALAAPVRDLVKGKAPSATLANDLSVVSSEPALNALTVVGGKSAFTLRNSRIALSGPGTNDFLGTGAGVLVRDNATLVLDGVSVQTNGRISSAAVAAEGAMLRIYNSRLVANGGPLPADYKPRIGPGMMEPPAPLGLTGTARTLLAMSNSRTYLYNSTIEADGWGALSTDATGGNLYLEANDCAVIVRRAGYGAYADFGAHVVLNRTRVDSGAYQAIIAGKARIDFDRVSGRAASSAVMIHSVMAFDPAEAGQLTVKDSRLASAGPLFVVKSANAEIAVTGGALTSDAGVLLEVRKNNDPNATQTRGAAVPGVRLGLNGGAYAGDVIDTDPDRTTTLALTGAKLTGRLADVVLSLDAASRWTARGESAVTLAQGSSLAGITVPVGAQVHFVTSDAALAAGLRALKTGGKIEVVEK